MSEKKRTDYSKLKTKSNSSSVRFNVEHLNFIKKREPLLKTSQQIVDFLLEAYCKTYKVQPNNPFKQPITYDDATLVIKERDPITPLRLDTPIISQYDVYLKEIYETNWSGGLEIIMAEAKKDVSPQQYSKLQLLAMEHAKTFSN
jgi:hypothetical protein